MTTTLAPPTAERPQPTPPPGIGPAWRPPTTGPGRTRWERPALAALLAATAVAYLWGLGASGWANSFYSAAVQAGASSWKAFFFGSSDAANFITIDKPPAALWVMELSARLFGVNAWSILVPQALEGVAAVGLLYAAVRRWFGAGGALLAGGVLALTPVASLMFRFNDPDALLVLLLTAAAYAMVRALEAGRTRWLVLAASLVGLGFLTKMLQALLVVPAFGLVYLLAAPTPLRRRIGQLLAAGAALAVSGLWWVVAVQLIPAADRPYIGGSQNNSLWNLIFGYNGFGRLTGSESGSVGGGATGTSGRWGATGLLRLFNADFGGQASWLIPAALILLAAGLVATWRAARTDRTRAALVLWGGWLLVTGAVISLGQGIIHPYYTVALAPAIGAVVGIGAATMWARRDHWAARLTLAGTLVAATGWAYVLLGRSPGWYPWLRGVDLAVGLGVAVLLVAWTRLRGRVGALIAAGAVVAGLAGPAAYTLATVSSAHTGAIPSAGPAVTTRFGPGGAGGGRFAPAAGRSAGAAAFAGPRGGPGTGFPGAGGTPPAGGGTGPGRAGFGGGGGGGAGGLLDGSTPTAAVTAALDLDSGRYTWVAATVGSNQASGYQLASGRPVMAIGGFNGTDPAPTLAAFEADVSAGRIHYFIAGGGFGTGTASTTAGQITSWVESHFTAITVGGTTLYDLTAPAAAT